MAARVSPLERLATSREKLRQSLKRTQGSERDSTNPITTAAVFDLVLPCAQKHPFGLVLGAFVVGGLLTWSRSWGNPLVSVIATELLPRVSPTLGAPASPLGWIDLLSPLARQGRKTAD